MYSLLRGNCTSQQESFSGVASAAPGGFLWFVGDPGVQPGVRAPAWSSQMCQVIAGTAAGRHQHLHAGRT